MQSTFIIELNIKNNKNNNGHTDKIYRIAISHIIIYN